MEFEDRLYAQTQKQIKTNHTDAELDTTSFSVSCRHRKCEHFGSRKVLLMRDTALSPAKLLTTDQSSQITTCIKFTLDRPGQYLDLISTSHQCQKSKTDLCFGFVTN